MDEEGCGKIKERRMAGLEITLPSCAQLATCSPSSSTARLTMGLVCCE